MNQEDDLKQITAKARATTDISHIHAFLGTKTSESWLKLAKANLPLLMQDHANCEKKAAGTAMNLIFRYESHRQLQERLAQLVREEMLHYEQVLSLMKERGIKWSYLPAGRYAKGLLKHKRTWESAAMVDVLIIGAFIEARSCERFKALADVIDDEKLARYYRYLLKSESRHYEDYLMLAQSVSKEPIDERVAFFRDVEAALIDETDDELRFHSGVPSQALLGELGAA
ncbi:tRNA-(ms[2]io[6]A)-hydroxylase [Moraxella nasovis]|uniref:tRNA-(ms[2]io[6]A)-hydroxylase n=1 Tax=Moraxella nasovis TaxID=2904121 RepID=UPI001F60FB59|nr:tRNA-(ms[2]io[6]A)-hydroxylase [Moraxella nasovis]UNU73001.1 tRNA-(ms[2]io[6]A)-hydroxylase [Moraxella nasovis]